MERGRLLGGEGDGGERQADGWSGQAGLEVMSGAAGRGVTGPFGSGGRSEAGYKVTLF